MSIQDVGLSTEHETNAIKRQSSTKKVVQWFSSDEDKTVPLTGFCMKLQQNKIEDLFRHDFEFLLEKECSEETRASETMPLCLSRARREPRLIAPTHSPAGTSMPPAPPPCAFLTTNYCNT